jgi:hypothetical protein
MAKIDPEQERRRLAEFYTQQLDGELEKVASQAYELTDLAREVLRAELNRRGIAGKLVEQAPVILKKEPTGPRPGDPPAATGIEPEAQKDQVEFQQEGELDFQRMVTIRRFRDLPEALIAKGSLDSAGIDSVLVNDNLVRLDWFWSNLMGGVQLQVEAEDADSANEILNQPIPESFDAGGTGEYQQPRCPSCGSLDVSFQELNKPVAYVSAYAGLPLPIRRQAWRCHACNAEWEDDDHNGAASNS